MSQTFTSVDDQCLCTTIANAAHRVVFVAPGVSETVAKALAGAWQRLGQNNVSVILDVDPAICRLGYGSLEGLELLQKTAVSHNSMICHQPGLRIGILINDAATLVYTPTPLLIEAEIPNRPAEQSQQMDLLSSAPPPPPRPNGILLASPPTTLAADLGIGTGGVADRKIGLDRVPEAQVQALAQDLKANPPLPFDIARPVLVFNSQIEFVEFGLEKIQLQRQEIPIPSEVMGLAAKNIHGLFRLNPGDDLIAKKDELEKLKHELDKKFTRPARGFGGSLIRRVDKDEFLGEVKKLEAELEKFRTIVRAQFQAIADKNRQELISNLLPALKRSSPKDCLPFLTAKDGDARLLKWLQLQLDKPFAKVAKVADEMRVSYRFKGVTFECLKDPEFVARAQEAFPDLQLHEEFTAAPERPPQN